MKPNNDGVRKAAILVSTLDQSAADRVLDQMEPQQAQLVRRAMVELCEIDPKEQRRIIDEFFRVGPMVPKKEPPGIELDGPEMANLSLPTSPPDELPEPETADGPPFRFLREAEAENLSKILIAERPQTIALVISHLAPEQAGRVLARFPPDLQVEVIRRLVDLEETEPEILRDVERTLESRLSEQFGTQRRRVAGLAAVAGILKTVDKRTGMQILANLAAHDRQLADRLGPVPLEFDDLVRLDEATLATILKAAGRELMVLSLVGSRGEVIERFLRRLGESEAESVRHELDHPGPVRLSDVNEARRRIVQLARRMAVEGQITLPPRGQAAFPIPERLKTAA